MYVYISRNFDWIALKKRWRKVRGLNFCHGFVAEGVRKTRIDWEKFSFVIFFFWKVPQIGHFDWFKKKNNWFETLLNFVEWQKVIASDHSKQIFFKQIFV